MILARRPASRDGERARNPVIPILGLTWLVAGCAAASEGRLEYREDFQRRFDEAGVQGVFVTYEPSEDRYLANDFERMETAFIPASTYKIFNALVALETGVLEDETVTLPWDGVDRGWSMWNRDHDLRSAVQHSAVWFFQEVARRVGEERMQAHLDRAGYGNGDLSGGIDRFWLDGGLRISPHEQVQFLHRLQRGELPFSTRTMDLVREILVIEETDSFVLRAKTGWGVSSSPQVGWFVGYVQRGSKTLFFAMNLDIVEEQDAAARVAVTRRILGDLGAIGPDG